MLGRIEIKSITFPRGEVGTMIVNDVRIHVVVERCVDGVWAEYIHMVNPNNKDAEDINRLLKQPDVYRIKELNTAP